MEEEVILEISQVKLVSSGFTDNPVLEISFVSGDVFFIRPGYLKYVSAETLISGAKFADEFADDLMTAGLAYSAERKAVDYLARCEQCRFSLANKLVQKGHERNAVELALDFLESKKLLDDYRFALVWCKNHLISKPQGRIRLSKELISRGISKNISDAVLDEIFSEIDEYELCMKSYKKAVQQKKNGDKLLKYLIDCGFPYKSIKKVIKNSENL